MPYSQCPHGVSAVVLFKMKPAATALSLRPVAHILKTPGETYHTEECAASSRAVGGRRGHRPGHTHWTPGIPHHHWDPTFNRVTDRGELWPESQVCWINQTVQLKEIIMWQLCLHRGRKLQNVLSSQLDFKLKTVDVNVLCSSYDIENLFLNCFVFSIRFCSISGWVVLTDCQG